MSGHFFCRLFLPVALVWLTGCSPSADPLSAVQRGDYHVAETVWEQEATQNNSAEAQNYLGILYYMGLLSGKREPLKAAPLFRQAAESGYAPAQFNLGILYFNEEAGKKDIYQAYLWLYASSLQHHDRAQIYLDLLSSLTTINLAKKAQFEAAKYVPLLDRPDKAPPPDSSG